MKKYQAPELEWVTFMSEDILSESSNYTNGGTGNVSGDSGMFGSIGNELDGYKM